MPAFPPRAGRLAIVAACLLLGLTACGRRGPLEAPPAASAPAGQTPAERQAAADAEAEENEARQTGGAFLPSPTPTPSGRSTARTLPTRPKTPFILDPLL